VKLHSSTAELIKDLGHENSYHVTSARKQLQHQFGKLPDSDGKKQQVILLLKNSMKGSKTLTGKLNLLWTLHALNGIDQTETLALLKDSEPMIRSWMVRLATESRTVSSDILAQFVQMAGGARSLVVRRELASALQKLPNEQRWDLATALAAHHDSQYDKMIPLLIWYGVEPLVVQDTKRTLTLAQNAHIPLVSNFIFRRAASSAETLPHLVKSIPGMNKNLAKQAILELATTMKSSGKVKAPAGWPEVTGKYAASQDAQIRAAIQAISVTFGDQSIFPQLRKTLANKKSDLNSRKNAMNILVQGKDQLIVPILLALLDEAPLRTAALKALSSFDSKEIPTAILSRIKAWQPSVQATAVATLCSRVAYAKTLLDAMQQGNIPRSYVTAVHVTQLQQLGDKKLLEKVGKVWGSIRQTPAEKLKQIASLKKTLTPKHLAQADKSEGRVVYDKTCGQCHQLFGTGGKVGPDITGSNRKKLDYLLENMIDPNALVGKDYQAVSVVTVDGRVVTGLIKEENDTAVVLQTVEDVVTVAKSDIEERSQTAQSIMPEGQLKTLSQKQIQDLIAYLQSDSQIPLPGQGPFYDVQKGIVPGAIEGESLKVMKVTDGAIHMQGMSPFKKDRWSGSKHLWWTGGKQGSILTLEFPVDKMETYEVLAVLTKAHDYGKVKVRIDDQQQVTEFDLFSKSDVITTGVVSLGTMKLEAGKHLLHIEISGKHPDATPSYMFGIDYLYLSKPTVSTKESTKK
jgi:putative heme-binding domain-containing protein